MQFCIDEAPCIFFAAKDDGTLVAANTSLCTLLGFEQSSLIGEKVDRILTIPSRIFQQTHFFPLLKMKGHAEEIYITLRGSDGHELPVLINAERKMVDGQAVSFYIGIVVHNRKKFEDELVAARKAAETALRENSELLRIKTELNEHAETLDRQMGQLKRQNVELLQFNRVVTHDLQEPLRKLFIFTNLMLEGKEEIGSTRTVEKIRTVSEQMRSIVSGLQQYIWLTDAAENRRTVDLNQVMTSIIKTITDSSSDVEINFEGDHLPLIVGDEEQLHFLFQELVANAMQNRKPNQGLHIRIVATGLMKNSFKSLPGKYQYTEHLRLQVIDDGMGFDGQYRQQVFELFKRLHGGKGRGVGLSLCKKIVENHGGEISIDSSPGLGTTVTLFFPILTLHKNENIKPQQ